MAGTILISKGEGVPMKSAAFDHLVEEIRTSMGDPAEAAFADVYRPYVHEGMMFIAWALYCHSPLRLWSQ